MLLKLREEKTGPEKVLEHRIPPKYILLCCHKLMGPQISSYQLLTLEVCIEVHSD